MIDGKSNTCTPRKLGEAMSYVEIILNFLCFAGAVAIAYFATNNIYIQIPVLAIAYILLLLTVFGIYFWW